VAEAVVDSSAEQQETATVTVRLAPAVTARLVTARLAPAATVLSVLTVRLQRAFRASPTNPAFLLFLTSNVTPEFQVTSAGTLFSSRAVSSSAPGSSGSPPREAASPRLK
jgi:hypothetical protein